MEQFHVEGTAPAPAEDGSREITAEAKAKAKKNSVLVIDDESLNILALTRILSADYVVYAAKSGESGVKAAEKYLPDVVLLDVLMPEMDGYAVISALKNLERTKEIPVIFITGLSSADDEEKGLALGASDYIAKPFSPSIVKLRVQNQIRMLDQMRTIEKLGMIDQLTDLPNRRGFDLRLQAEWGRALREQTPISILMVDVDKFKDYNDAFGHQQGDVALRTLANTFTRTLKRSSDFAARWGGEEFIALLPGTDFHGALDVAEQTRENIENMEIFCSNEAAAKITVSIGVNTLTYEHENTISGFVSGADKALYTAKAMGRNKVCHFAGS